MFFCYLVRRSFLHVSSKTYQPALPTSYSPLCSHHHQRVNQRLRPVSKVWGRPKPGEQQQQQPGAGGGTSSAPATAAGYPPAAASPAPAPAPAAASGPSSGRGSWGGSDAAQVNERARLLPGVAVRFLSPLTATLTLLVYCCGVQIFFFLPVCTIF